MPVTERLSAGECYLVAILEDRSGLDLAEFCWYAPENEDGCFRAWPFQWSWWRCEDPQQIDQAARSVGKSLSIKARGFNFCFNFPGQEMVVTAPELIHLEPIVGLIENQILDTRLSREMLKKGRSSVNHRPFMMQFQNGARLIGRIPQRDGRGAKGIHPIRLEQDECFPAGTLILTRRGLVPIELVVIGDAVMTHLGRWRAVTDVFERGVRHAVVVRGQGHPGITCTPDHKFWGRRILQFSDTKHRWGAVKVGDLGWQEAHTLPDCYWASPTAFPETELWPILERSATGNSSPVDPNTVDFAWALGLFLAEGSLSSSNGGVLNRIYWSIHIKEVAEVVDRIRRLGLPVSTVPSQASDQCVSILVHHRNMADWLAESVGRGAINKQIPVDVFGRSEEYRRAVLEGLVFGDGFIDPDERYAPGRWKLTTASRRLAIGTRLLALSLGFHVSVHWNESRPSSIRGREVHGNGWYQVVGNMKGQGRAEDGLMLTRVREVVPTEDQPMYDLTVDEDHSFIAEGIVVKNSQDYPEKGWTELNETVKRGFKNSQWRAHGVTRGVQGSFYTRTQEGSGWTVHRITAMMRPNWTEEERAKAIAAYGSAEDPDYRRNILGFHGDATNMLFVLRQLMRCVDVDLTDDYNTEHYFHRFVRDTDLDAINDPERGVGELLTRINLPPVPTVYAQPGHRIWIGMDVGFTSDPSEIVIAVEYKPTEEELAEDRASKSRGRPRKGQSRIRLIGRITLRRIPSPLQTEVILHCISHYDPAAFSMDATGNGLPLFQGVLNRLRAAAGNDQAKLKRAAEQIRGYNFSEKVLVDIVDPKADKLRQEKQGTANEATNEDLAAGAGVKRNVLEYSTDKLREVVDESRWMMPWDKDAQPTSIIDEFHGQTFSYSNSPMDQYGHRRRIFSEGRFHTLDACRMLVMGMFQQVIEVFMDTKPVQQPVIDRGLR